MSEDPRSSKKIDINQNFNDQPPQLHNTPESSTSDFSNTHLGSSAGVWGVFASWVLNLCHLRVTISFLFYADSKLNYIVCRIESSNLSRVALLHSIAILVKAKIAARKSGFNQPVCNHSNRKVQILYDVHTCVCDRIPTVLKYEIFPSLSLQITNVINI